ncbi:MAG: alpha/beta hydrolase [Candidatus Zixiibacteriota bacterium]
MFLWLFIFVFGVFLLLCGALYFFQKKLVFYPVRGFTVAPDQLNLQYEDVYVTVTSEERVHGWYFPANNPDSSEEVPVVLFCHGNAGNISHRLETVDFILSLGAAILLFDYRGYGQSNGSPSEANVYADAEACYFWLIDQKGIQPENIVLFGRSIGGTVAVELARKVKCRGLIVESSFTSAEDMGKRMFPLVPIKYLLRYKFDSIGKLGSVHCPILITHSPDDEIVPFEMGKKLFAVANEPKQFVPLRGGHNEREYLADSVYKQAVHDLIHNRQ